MKVISKANGRGVTMSAYDVVRRQNFSMRRTMSALVFSTFLTSSCLSASSTIQEAQKPAESADLRNKIDAGLSRNLLSLKAQGQNVYPLWAKSENPIEFVVFSGQKFFYSGMFFAHLSMLADVTGTKFDVGARPHLVAIFAENLKSWQDVTDFLAKQSASFQLPKLASNELFTGCNTLKYSNDGAINLSIIVIDITESRSFAQIDTCMFRTLMDVFGFDTQAQPKNLVSDLNVLRIMYELDVRNRNTNEIAGEILKRMLMDQRF